jgi:hypothetical protein
MRTSSKTLLFALAMVGCSIYDDALDGLSDATAAGSGGTRDGGGFSGTGGSAAKDGSAAAAGAADATGAAGRGGASGAAGTSVADSATGSGGQSGAAGASGADAAAGGSGTAGSGGTSGAGGSAGGSGASGAAGNTGLDGSSGADRSSGVDGADAAQPCVIGTGPANLPFAVDQYFVASGWMQPAFIRQEASCLYPPDAGPMQDASGGADSSTGDAQSDRDGSVASDGSTVPPLPGSKCWTITYTPTVATDWAGVDWQYPIDNWGQSPGLVIPPGATRVSVVAWGDLGSERVTFQVGYGPTTPDGFVASLTQQLLTTTPARYAIDLRGIAYTCHSVRMGFGWLAEGGTTMTFHIADIRWE